MMAAVNLLCPCPVTHQPCSGIALGTLDLAVITADTLVLWSYCTPQDDVEKAHDQAKPKPGWVPEGAAACDPSLAANLKPSDGE